MPPSGYTHQQADLIRSFLASCVEALEAENSASGRKASEGLRHEILGIDSVLANCAAQPFALQTLLLTREFYARLLERDPGTCEDLRAAVPHVMESVVSEITSVHVDVPVTTS
jgi:hypothetical protein